MRQAFVLPPDSRGEPNLRPLLAGIAVLLLSFAARAAPGAEAVPTRPAETITPVLERALEDPAGPAWRNGRLAVWVYFIEPLRTPAETNRALDVAAARLSERALQRRRKMPGWRERPVDERDLPLNPTCLAAAAATGASLRRPSRWLRAASYDATPDQAQALASLSCVHRVDIVRRAVPVEPVTAPDGSFPEAPGPGEGSSTWSLDYGSSLATLELINVPPVHELGYTGAGVLVAMLDTGFRMTHESLDHVPVVAAYDFAGDDPNVDTEPGDAADSHVHGSQAAAMLMGYAPGHIMGPAYAVTALLARASQDSVDSTVEGDYWVAAVEWAEAEGADIVSSSLGFWDLEDPLVVDGDTHPSTVAADLAAARGVVVVNGCGNLGDTEFDTIVAPADGDSVIAVGAVDSAGVSAPWSSSGPTTDGRIKPDVCARGEFVPVPDPSTVNDYTRTGGTSFSGPLVAGVAALILERAPFLTPIQVREALRQTADHRDAPDNDYGWGVVDATAALWYWGPRFGHAPLADTEDTEGPYVVTAAVTDPFGLDPGGPTLRFRTGGGAWEDVPMTPGPESEFTASIPGFPSGTLVEYYLEASDVQGLSARFPVAAPDDVFAFNVATDTEPPQVVHKPLADQPLGIWPPEVLARVTDNLGVAGVDLAYTLNGGPVEGPFAMSSGPDHVYSLPFPIPASALAAGDVLAYTVTARDASQRTNVRQVGPFNLGVHAGIGNVLLVDDTGSGDGGGVSDWLTAAGYAVTLKVGTELVSADLSGQDVMVLVSGGNDSPLESERLRYLVETWVGDGRGLLVEGGETAYNALVLPGYPSFAVNVLHIVDWRGDGGDPLLAAEGQAGHPLLNSPVAVTLPLTFDSPAESELDEVIPSPGATLVLRNSDEFPTAGAIVFDASITDQAGSVVYYAFALSAVADPGQAGSLAVNGVSYLLSPQGITPVRLLSFDAWREAAGARLTWSVADATDHAGFHVHREEPDGRRLRLTGAILSGRTRYAFLDPDPPAERVSYWLAELSRSGAVAWHGPALLPPMEPGIVPVPPRAFPNPSRAEIAIRYALSRRERVGIRIFDTAGRLVREQPVAPRGPGEHTWTWDRSDRAGVPVRSGVYFFVVTMEEGATSGKITILP